MIIQLNRKNLDEYLCSSILPILFNPMIISTTLHNQSLQQKFIKKKKLHWSALAQVMACCLTAPKPFREPKLIKSPWSGVTLCLQFVSATTSAATAMTFASHVKTVWAKP